MNNCEPDICEETKTHVNAVLETMEQLDGCTRKINRAHLEDMLAQIRHLIEIEPEKEPAYALDALNRVYLAERMRHISPFEARSYLVSFMPAVRKWEQENAERCELMTVLMPV